MRAESFSPTVQLEVHRHCADWMKVDSSKQKLCLTHCFFLSVPLECFPPVAFHSVMHSIIVMMHSVILLLLQIFHAQCVGDGEFFATMPCGETLNSDLTEVNEGVSHCVDTSVPHCLRWLFFYSRFTVEGILRKHTACSQYPYSFPQSAWIFSSCWCRCRCSCRC